MAAPSPIGINYSYDNVPTIAKFAASDAFIRGLVGCFRSGKSSGCVIEVMRRAVCQRPSPDGVRRTRWVVVRNCFDDQTEILTEKRGWQLFKDLKEDDKVASLRNGTELFFDKVKVHYSDDYKGDMIGIANDAMDFLVTPNHFLWTSTRTTRKKVWQPYKHEKAEDAFNNQLRRFKRNAEWLGGEARYGLDFYEFLGFWFAEGYAGAYQYSDRKEPHWRFMVMQKKYLAYVRELLLRAGLQWGEDNRGDGYFGFRIKVADALKPLVKELSGLGKAPEKYLPEWLKNCPAGHARAFIHGYIMGDGNLKDAPHTTSRAYTASKRLADDLQELALRAGMVVNIARRDALRLRGPRGVCQSKAPYQYIISFLQPGRYEPTTQRNTKHRDWYKQAYDGVVYCVEVESHVVYVRRNGKAMWCGQTTPQLEDTTIRTFHMWVPPQHFGRYYESDHTYLIKGMPGCEIEILFRALDRPEHIKNLLSLEVTGAWVNEAREVPWPIIETLQARVGQYPPKAMNGCTWGGLFMDTNPPDVDSKWYKFFEETKHDPSFAQIFKQPSGLGPDAENLSNLTSPNYYKNLATGKSAEWVKVYIHGEYGFIIDGKPVFPEFKDATHCKAVDPVSGVPVYRSWDWGLTPACVFSQVLPDGRWLVFDEMNSENMGIDRFSDEVLEHSAVSFPRGAEFLDIGDPAGNSRAQTDERTVFDILQKKGIDIQPGEITVTLRLESVRKVLNSLVGGEPRFVIHPRCKMLRKGLLGGYQYRRLQVSAERYTMVPEKNKFSHGADALCYAASKIFGGGLTMRQDEMEDFGSLGYRQDDRGRSSITGY